MSVFRAAFPLVFLSIIACSEAEDTSSEWWEDWEDSTGDDDTDITDTDKGGSTDTDKGDTDKGDSGYPDCADDFDPTADCVGDWKETICTYEDTIYWCEDGSWKNENDK